LKIAALASFGPSLTKFRGPLLGAMAAAGHEVIASAPDCSSEVIAELSQLGVRYEHLPLDRRGLNPLRDLLYVRDVYRFLRRENVDLCFFYTIKPVIFGSFAARVAGISSIVSLITGLGYTFIANDFKGRSVSAITRRLYRAALRLNRVVFFQNRDDQELFVNLGLVARRKTIVVNGSGVDLNFYTPAPVPDGPPVFLMIARLLKAKGVLEFLTAAKQVKARYPDCRFRLVGPYEKGPDAIAEEEIRSRISSGTVEYVGQLADVRPELHACSVYVLPSYREGTPRSVLEAMACGRAVITTNAPGCKETVIEGYNGYMVDPRNSAQLADAICRFAAHPALAIERGANSRRLAEEKYDVNKINRVMLEGMGLKPPPTGSNSQHTSAITSNLAGTSARS
jgi:glycosyltransferase involved in cell wall biosynthesis